MKAAVVVVAAGRGARFGAGLPKQFRLMAGKPLLLLSLKAFEKTPSVSAVVLVVAPDRAAWAGRFIRRERLRKVSAVVAGGKERAESVRNGVRACPPGADVVLIHDAARALVTPDIADRVARAAVRTGAALAAWPVPDTLKMARGGKRLLVRRTVPRGGLWSAQTPQGFRADLARRLFSRPSPADITDDVQLAERAGLPVELVPASPANFKVTLPEDFRLCAALLKE